MSMLPFKRILCPTDFSEPALAALKRADELARHFSAELLVAHAIPEIPGPGLPEGLTEKGVATEQTWVPQGS